MVRVVQATPIIFSATWPGLNVELKHFHTQKHHKRRNAKEIGRMAVQIDHCTPRPMERKESSESAQVSKYNRSCAFCREALPLSLTRGLFLSVYQSALKSCLSVDRHSLLRISEKKSTNYSIPTSSVISTRADFLECVRNVRAQILELKFFLSTVYTKLIIGSIRTEQ